MEKGEQPGQQVEEQEIEETNLLLRKPRTVSGRKITEIDHVNGVSKNNGSLVSANGAQNQDSPLEIEGKIKELDGFLENEPEIKNGEQKSETLEFGEVPGNEPEDKDGEPKSENLELDEVLGNEPEVKDGKQKSENLVFYDRDEGIWKCRICSWTYRNGSVCVDHFQNHKGQLHRVLNFKTFNYETEDFGEQKIEKDIGHDKPDISSNDFIHHKNSTEIHKQSKGNLDDISSSPPNFQPSQSLSQEERLSSKEIESADIDLINEDELEVTEFDVEKVIQKQNTHDLYCPNCNSCITRRVILRKRKRRGRFSDEEIKRNKIQEEPAADFISSTVDGDEHAIEPTVDDGDEHMREPEKDVFRCLSCFSFFIPSGDGFKLFRKSGEESGKENAQDEPSVRTNWFTSMFASKKNEKSDEQGSNLRTSNVGVGSSYNFGDQSVQPLLVQGAHEVAHTSRGVVGSSGRKATKESRDKMKSSLNGKVTNGAEDTYHKTTDKIGSNLHISNVGVGSSFNLVDQSVQPLLEQEAHVVAHTSKGVLLGSSGRNNTRESGDKIESALNGKVTNGAEYIYDKTTEEIDKEDLHLVPPSVSVPKESDTEGKLSISVAIPHEEQEVGAYILTESVENRNATYKSSDTGHIFPTEVSQQIITKSKYEVHTGEMLKVDNISSVTGVSIAQGGKDTVITIDTWPAESSQTLQSTILPTGPSSMLLSGGSQITIGDRERSNQGTKEIEVIKSIVYGGLAEAITSLSVVSSAVGGGASTLNILALGMASLFGGLLIIFHNLWDLRCDREAPQVSNQISNPVTEERDRYKQLLGRRENFVLHAVVTIISYIIFGLVPPVVFGFSFRSSDDKEFKLLAMAAASFLCILILAIGKAYVCRPPRPYLKTVLTFVILGFMVAGVSYWAGVLVERLLEKLRLFQPSSVSDLLVPEITPTAWASY